MTQISVPARNAQLGMLAAPFGYRAAAGAAPAVIGAGAPVSAVARVVTAGEAVGAAAPPEILTVTDDGTGVTVGIGGSAEILEVVFDDDPTTVAAADGVIVPQRYRAGLEDVNFAAIDNTETGTTASGAKYWRYRDGSTVLVELLEINDFPQAWDPDCQIVRDVFERSAAEAWPLRVVFRGGGLYNIGAESYQHDAGYGNETRWRITAGKFQIGRRRVGIMGQTASRPVTFFGRSVEIEDGDWLIDHVAFVMADPNTASNASNARPLIFAPDVTRDGKCQVNNVTVQGASDEAFDVFPTGTNRFTSLSVLGLFVFDCLAVPGNGAPVNGEEPPHPNYPMWHEAKHAYGSYIGEGAGEIAFTGCAYVGVFARSPMFTAGTRNIAIESHLVYGMAYDTPIVPNQAYRSWKQTIYEDAAWGYGPKGIVIGNLHWQPTRLTPSTIAGEPTGAGTAFYDNAASAGLTGDSDERRGLERWEGRNFVRAGLSNFNYDDADGVTGLLRQRPKEADDAPFTASGNKVRERTSRPVWHRAAPFPEAVTKAQIKALAGAWPAQRALYPRLQTVLARMDAVDAETNFSNISDRLWRDARNVNDLKANYPAAAAYWPSGGGEGSIKPADLVAVESVANGDDPPTWASRMPDAPWADVAGLTELERYFEKLCRTVCGGISPDNLDRPCATWAGDAVEIDAANRTVTLTKTATADVDAVIAYRGGATTTLRLRRAA